MPSGPHMATHVNEVESFSYDCRVAAKDIRKIGTASKTKSQRISHSLSTFLLHLLRRTRFFFHMDFFPPHKRLNGPHPLDFFFFKIIMISGRGVRPDVSVSRTGCVRTYLMCAVSSVNTQSGVALRSRCQCHAESCLPSGKSARTPRERAPMGLCGPLETLHS